MERKHSYLLLNLLHVNVAFITNAQEIPPNEAQVNPWFQAAVKPSGQAKGLEPAAKAADTGPPQIIEVPGKVKTITDALKQVKPGNTKRTVIKIGPGQYREKIKLERNKPYVTFYGTDPKNRPVISFAGNAAKYGTIDSATLIVEADHFVAANIVVANASPRPNGKMKGAQAAALRISGDKAAFYNCKFTGFQDTVCDDKGKHFFKDCYIEGTVDFIFGEAKSLYLNTELHVLPGDKMAMITAHARKSPSADTGYSFVHCKVTGTGGHAVLGRAWFEAPRVVYSYCSLSNAVKPEGWSDNQKPAVQKTTFFGEYKNTGPGASPAKRVPYTKHLSPAQAKPFISLEYIEAAKWLLPPPRL